MSIKQNNESGAPTDDFAYGTIALFGARFHTLRLSARLDNSCQAGHGLDNTSYNPGYATRGRLPNIPENGILYRKKKDLISA
jgi:hypothetical protein